MRILSFGVVALVLAHAPQAAAVPLYEVDFSSPTHTVDQLPAVGAGPFPRDTPTSINFGAPRVREAVGPLSDQPLEFGATVSFYEQIEFDLGLGLRRYAIELDVVVTAQLDEPTIVGDSTGFAVLFDPTDQPDGIGVWMQGDGMIRFGTFGAPVIGSFTVGEAFHLGVTVDLWERLLFIYLDDELAHVAVYDFADLGQVRMGTQSLNVVGPLLAVDNVLITPEPATGWLVSAGLLGLAASRQRCARG